MNNYLIWFYVLIILSAWMWRGKELHEKRARMTAIAILSGLLLASFMPNDWIAAYTVVFVLGLLRVPSPADRLPLTVYPALMFAALYVLLSPLVTVQWVVPVLWSIGACGGILSLWWAFSMVMSQGHYDKLLQFRGKTVLHIYEHQPAWNILPKFCLGQGNENFAQALAGAAVAASVGLAIMGHPWAWLAAVACSLPCLKIRGSWWEWPHPTQGWGYLAVIAIAAFLTWDLWLGLFGIAVLVWITLSTLFKQPHFWSGRREIWQWGLQVWWDMSWQGKLIGAGPESWLHIFQRDCETGSARLAKQTAFATHSHNEFINALVETGVMGLVCMVGYIGTTMWGLFHVESVEAKAIFISGAYWIANAMVSFGISLYHEVAFMDRDGAVTGHGMPFANVMNLATILLAGAVLR